MKPPPNKWESMDAKPFFEFGPRLRLNLSAASRDFCGGDM
jgi:hypothetical protein